MAKSKTPQHAAGEGQLSPIVLDSLRKLRKDGGLKKLNELLTEFNAFEVLRSSGHEIRHSNVLAWLLNPRGNHKLHTQFLEEVLRVVQDINGRKICSCNNLISHIDSGMSECLVDREYHHRDIQLKFESVKVVVVIENKWDAGEDEGDDKKDGQLGRYKRDADKEFDDSWRKVFVFLTPERRRPKKSRDCESWGVLGYWDVCEVLDRVFAAAAYQKMPLAQRMFLKQYRSVIGRRVGHMKDELDVCDDISENYAEALRFIENWRFRVREEVMRRLRNAEDGKVLGLKVAADKSGKYVQLGRRFPATSKASVHYEVLAVDDGGLEVCFHVENKTNIATNRLDEFRNDLMRHDRTGDCLQKGSFKKASAGVVDTIGCDVDDVYEQVLNKLRKLTKMFECVLKRYEKTRGR